MRINYIKISHNPSGQDDYEVSHTQFSSNVFPIEQEVGWCKAIICVNV